MEWAAQHAKGSKAWAILGARKTGRKVVAPDETTTTSVTAANPDGTPTTEMPPGPARVWHGGKWREHDAETNTPITTPAGEGLPASGFAAPGQGATVQVPDGQLVDGKMYKFRTNTYDGTHHNLGWSPWRTSVVETAAADVPTTLQPGDSHTINDPELITDPARVEEVLNRDGSLEALGGKPRTGPSAAEPVATTAAWERTHTVPSQRLIRGRKPENNGLDPYEYITDVDECLDADDSDNTAGWLKNRFPYCQESPTVMPAIRCGPWPPGCYPLGVFISRNALVGRDRLGGLDSSTLTRVAEGETT
jgi:hypothetical protein